LYPSRKISKKVTVKIFTKKYAGFGVVGRRVEELFAGVNKSDGEKFWRKRNLESQCLQ